MKIQVVRRDGSHEVLTLTEPLTVGRGEHMNTLTTSTGMDHFFNQDGTYDGWGMAINITTEAQPDGSIPPEAKQFIDAIEKGREFPSA